MSRLILYFFLINMLNPWLRRAAQLSMASLTSFGVLAQSFPARAEEFIVRGTEPFWVVTIGKKEIVYSSPEVKAQRFPYVSPTPAAGRTLDFMRVYRWDQTSVSRLLILKRTGSCSDGMSDTRYTYSATLVIGSVVREGCAERKPEIRR